jgi:hypothetical protein
MASSTNPINMSALHGSQLDMLALEMEVKRDLAELKIKKQLDNERLSDSLKKADSSLKDNLKHLGAGVMMVLIFIEISSASGMHNNKDALKPLVQYSDDKIADDNTDLQTYQSDIAAISGIDDKSSPKVATEIKEYNQKIMLSQIDITGRRNNIQKVFQLFMTTLYMAMQAAVQTGASQEKMRERSSTIRRR